MPLLPFNANNPFVVQLDLDPEDGDDGSGPRAYVDAFLEQTGGGATATVLRR